MRISIEERTKPEEEENIKILRKYHNICATDLFAVLDCESNGKIDSMMLLDFMLEFMVKYHMDMEPAEVKVGDILRILVSLHRRFEEYNEHEKVLLNVFLAEIIL